MGRLLESLKKTNKAKAVSGDKTLKTVAIALIGKHLMLMDCTAPAAFNKVFLIFLYF